MQGVGRARVKVKIRTILRREMREGSFLQYRKKLEFLVHLCTAKRGYKRAQSEVWGGASNTISPPGTPNLQRPDAIVVSIQALDGRIVVEIRDARQGVVVYPENLKVYHRAEGLVVEQSEDTRLLTWCQEG